MGLDAGKARSRCGSWTVITILNRDLHVSRLCPGRFLADSSIWLAAARVIATLDIRKVLDAEGKEITPSAEFISGAVRSVQLPTWYA